MNNAVFILAQVFALLTAAQFVIAMRLYFAKRDAGHGNHVWTVVAVGAVLVHAWSLSVARTPETPHVVAGLFLLTMASILFWAAIASHGSSRPSVAFGATVPDRIVMKGPYRFVRHPFYLAYIIAFAGASILGAHWLQLLTTAVVFICYNRAASKEERLLAADDAVGVSYVKYMKATWRWCPCMW